MYLQKQPINFGTDGFFRFQKKKGSGRHFNDLSPFCFAPPLVMGYNDLILMTHSFFVSSHPRKAFTLIELLVVIAIIAILAVVVVLTLNPAEMLSQGRDANRLSDLSTFNSAMNLYNEDAGGSGSFGTAGITYISIPDPTASTTAGSNCSALGFPSTGYHCAGPNFYRRNDGTGWIPVNFSRDEHGVFTRNPARRSREYRCLRQILQVHDEWLHGLDALRHSRIGQIRLPCGFIPDWLDVRFAARRQPGRPELCYRPDRPSMLDGAKSECRCTEIIFTPLPERVRRQLHDWRRYSSKPRYKYFFHSKILL